MLDMYVDGDVAVRFVLITCDGVMREVVLGSDVRKGQQRHVVVPGMSEA